MTRQFDGLAELKFNAVLLYGMIFSALFCPGLLIIYLYKYNLFISLDVTKLVLLAIAIGSPLFGWSLFLVLQLFIFDFNITRLNFSESQVYDILLLASFQSFLVVNLSLGLSWLLDWDFQDFCRSIFYISISLSLLVLAIILRAKKTRPKHTNQTKNSEQ